MNVVQYELPNHIEKCGGRTEPCPACGKNITLKVGMDNHLKICIGDKHEYNKFNINLDLLRMLIFQLIINIIVNLWNTIHLKKIRI